MEKFVPTMLQMKMMAIMLEQKARKVFQAGGGQEHVVAQKILKPTDVAIALFDKKEPGSKVPVGFVYLAETNGQRAMQEEIYFEKEGTTISKHDAIKKGYTSPAFVIVDEKHDCENCENKNDCDEVKRLLLGGLDLQDNLIKAETDGKGGLNVEIKGNAGIIIAMLAEVIKNVSKKTKKDPIEILTQVCRYL